MTVRNDFAPRPVDTLIAALGNVRPAGQDQWTAQCPAHDDARNSLSVKLAENGKILLHCHAGCSQDDALAAARALVRGDPTAARQAAAVRRQPAFGEPVATYEYTDENGGLLFQVQRDAEKNFRQRRPTNLEPPADAWAYDVRGVPKVPYNLPGVRQAATDGTDIYVAEGEKDADALCSLGLVATTNAGGAGKWTPEHAEHLRGAARVVVLPDNDEPGVRHARAVRASLRQIARRVQVLRLPGLPEKGDVSDWLAQGRARADLEALANTTPRPPEWTSASNLMGTEMPDAEWIVPNMLSRPSLAVLSGWSGAYKSWVALDLSLACALGGQFMGHFALDPPERVMYVTADEDAAEVRRKLLMLARGARVDNGEHAATLDANLQTWINPLDLKDERAFGKLLDDVADYRPAIIVMDHLRLVLPGDENSSEYAAALKEKVAAIHAEHPCCVLLLHHWRKLAKEKDLNAPGQRARGTGALRGIMDHHITLERDDFGVATLTVEKNRKGQEPAPFCFNMRFRDLEGEVNISYVGAAEAAALGEPTVADLVMAMLEDIPSRHSTMAELVAKLAGRVSRNAVVKAVGGLVKHEKIITRKVGREIHVAVRRYAQDLLQEQITPTTPDDTKKVYPAKHDSKPYKDDD